MRVIVIGGGVVGMASAYYLAKAGCSVVVCDEKDDVGLGTSYANGAQLSYSFSDALASPSFLRGIPRLLAGFEPSSRLRPAPSFFSWGLRFLAQCTHARWETNTRDTYLDAVRSAELMHELVDDTGIDFSFRRSGKMVLLDSSASLRNAERSTELKRKQGCETEILTLAEATRIEPALDGLVEKPLAAVYSPNDDVGDANAFCAGVRAWLEQNTDAKFRLGSPVEQIEHSAGRASGVMIGDEQLDADAVVVAAGVGSSRWVRGIPIEGMRGYSITLPATEKAPNTSLTVLSHHFVFSRLGDRLRMAGFADFVTRRGYDTRTRADTLKALARQAAPDYADWDANDDHAWTGVRPMTPNSRPITRETQTPGLFANTGHGMLGWTLACVSGERLAGIVTRSHP